MASKPNFIRLAIENEGEHAFRIGLKVDDCPYEPSDPHAIYWVEGWFAAADDERAQRHIEGRV